MSAGQGKDAEQLAAAIDQGTPPGSVGDAELARDLEIVAMLRSRRGAYDPHPAARVDAKQRLMAALIEAQAQDRAAGAPPVAALPQPETTGFELTAPMPVLTGTFEETAVLGRVDETEVISRITEADLEPDLDPEPDDTSDPEVAPRPRRAGRHSLPSRSASTRPGSRSRRSSNRPASRGLRRRFAVVGAAAMVALIALVAAGNVAGRDALPGDAIYAMKRLSENTSLAFTFDDAARAQRHLELATTRIDEVEQLVRRGSASTPATTADPALVEAAMREFDASTGEGSRGVLGAEEDASGAAALGDLRTWASEQATRLALLRSSLPDPAVADADTSIALLDRLLGRTEALEARSSCSEVTSAVVDDLGRLPAEGTCAPRTQIADDPSTSATEDESSTTNTPEGSTGTTTPDDTTTPEDTTAPTPTEDGLPPELGPDGLPLPEGEGLSSNTSSSPDEEGSRVSIPLPLLPPVQLPPLLPGMPGITIG